VKDGWYGGSYYFIAFVEGVREMGGKWKGGSYSFIAFVEEIEGNGWKGGA
jgi:hypothetical protein